MKINRRLFKLYIPMAVMVISNFVFISNENRIAKLQEEKEYRESQEIKIVESVLRWKIKQYMQTINENNGSICISTIRGLGENKEFLNTFSDLKVSLKGESGCISDFNKGVLDKETGNKSIEISASGIKWETRKRVIVGYGYHSGNLGAAGGMVFLELINSKWEITGEKLDWVSKLHTPGNCRPEVKTYIMPTNLQPESGKRSKAHTV